MLFVKRDELGKIIAVSECAEAGFVEVLDVQDPQLQAFVSTIAKTKSSLDESDLDFIRVLEDLLELLVAKNLILFTELPEKAQEKIATRQALRHNMNSRLDILSDDDDDFFPAL